MCVCVCVGKLCVIILSATFFSPAPLELKQPHFHPPSGNQDVDLNMTFDVTTPDEVAKKQAKVSSKKTGLGLLA